MGEQAYPKDHPRHPANAGKKFSEPRTPINSDYPDNHPARGGQGQPVPTEGVPSLPREGFRHLCGLDISTLAKAQAQFAALPLAEREARLKWNDEGIPAEVVDKEIERQAALEVIEPDGAE